MRSLYVSYGRHGPEKYGILIVCISTCVTCSLSHCLVYRSQLGQGNGIPSLYRWEQSCFGGYHSPLRRAPWDGGLREGGKLHNSEEGAVGPAAMLPGSETSFDDVTGVETAFFIRGGVVP